MKILNFQEEKTEHFKKLWLNEQVLAKNKYYKYRNRSNFKRDINSIFNILWVILGGWISALSCLFLGVFYCLTIIGIPLGVVAFKVIKLSFAPYNKRVVLNFKSNILFNVLWLIFGGLLSSVSYYVLSIMCRLTIIGIPYGKQLAKFGRYFLAPFGAKIIKNNECSSDDDKKSIFTYQYIRRNNIYWEEEEINKLKTKKGQPFTYAHYEMLHKNDIEYYSSIIKEYIFGVITFLLFIIFGVYLKSIWPIEFFSFIIIIGILGFSLCLPVIGRMIKVDYLLYYGYVLDECYYLLENKYIREHYLPLYDKYKNEVDRIIEDEYKKIF